MLTVITDPSFYSYVFSSYTHVFNTPEFNLLNSAKCDELFFLLFGEKKYSLGIILGRRGDVLCSPFSAPFGGFSHRDEVSVDSLCKAARELIDFAQQRHLSIKISLPPYFYEPDFLEKSVYAFLNSGFKIQYSDINYHFSLDSYADYNDILKRNARKNLKRAMTYDLDFRKAVTPDDIEMAYSTIKANREFRGYPLKMSLQDVKDTVKIIDADFFNLFYEGVSIAAAQVFHVAKDIVQVIYWGDCPGYGHIRPVNYLAYCLVDYYKSLGVKYIDVGPSSEFGVPNTGLCDFKESIGCLSTNKFTLCFATDAL